ncbi:MAG: SCP2 sterol-binding domain-containing protein [Candidatus Obscuribacterales bacterium]|nr:SCP2 sterol-binding domain-containing protein [Candidatus Obscuribacterales bacterium]
MAVFSSTEELHEVMMSLWEEIKVSPDMAQKLIDSKLIVQFRYREPEGLLTIDCSDGATMKIHSGPTNIKPMIEMSMKADIAHEFWLGKVNVPMALMMGKIVSRGPTPKALALLPVIKPAYAIYPGVLEGKGKNAQMAG